MSVTGDIPIQVNRDRFAENGHLKDADRVEDADIYWQSQYARALRGRYEYKCKLLLLT